MNILNILPEEITYSIYKKYYSDNVLPQLKPKCFYHVGLGQGRPKFRCNLNTIDSAFCMACWHTFKYF